MTQKTYTIPADLLQAIVNVLNEQPAKVTRSMLNAVEHFCGEQDKAAEVSPTDLVPTGA